MLVKIKIVLCVFLGVFLASSCVTRSRCLKRFPPATDSIYTVKDSIVTIYRDTIIYIHLPGEIQTDSVIIPCPPPKADFIPDTAYAKTSLAEAWAWWKYPSIKLRLVQRDSIINAELKDALMQKYYWHNEYNKVTKVIKEKYVPGFYKTCTFLFLGICLALIGAIALRIFLFKT